MWQWRSRWRRMLFANVKSKLGALMVVFTALAVSGRAWEWMVTPLRDERATSVERPVVSPGAGALFGWLGGFRALAADFLWLRMHALWETRDLPGTQTLIGLTTAVDPRPIYFWLNGARILAYDLPAWRIGAEGGYETVPVERQRVIEAEQARLALRHIAAARRVQPASATLWIEQANIELNRLHDVAAAAESYRQAWAQPGAPYYAARLHAELLRRLGRKAEAYAWLRALHPQLPGHDEGAGAVLVLTRIRELERELAMSPPETYQPKSE